MSWSKWIRVSHRWLSVAFTAVVALNGVVIAMARYNQRLGLLAVFVLALMFLTGAYLFLLPYAAKMRGRRAA